MKLLLILLLFIVFVSVLGNMPPPGPETPAKQVAAIVTADPERALKNAADMLERHARNQPEVEASEADRIWTEIKNVAQSSEHYADTQRLLPLVEKLRAEVHDRDLKRFSERLEIEAAAERKRIEHDNVGRANYAREMETRFLKKFYDVNVKSVGERGTTLRIQFVLMSRPFVYNALNESKLTEEASERGFKMIVFTDGYNSTWTHNLAKQKIP